MRVNDGMNAMFGGRGNMWRLDIACKIHLQSKRSVCCEERRCKVQCLYDFRVALVHCLYYKIHTCL